jgi:IS5 family transposase
MKTPSLFWKQQREAKRENLGPDFFKIRTVIDFEQFRPILDEALQRKNDKEKGGRPPYDCVLMFRILVLQELYQLSDDEMEFQIYDRSSFQQFVGIRDGDPIPDAKTIWVFKDKLADQNVHKSLFDTFQTQLEASGYHARSGQIVDATIHEVRRPRSKDPNAYETPSSKAQRDPNATFTKKGGKIFFGYKNHVNVDRKHRLVRTYDVTTASTHDSQVFEDILDPQNSALDIWADSAYKSEKHDDLCESKAYRNKIHHRAYRNKPLTGHQERANKARSKVRALVEHTFAYGKNWGKKITLRGIGMEKAVLNIGLKNLTYNMRRFLFLEKRQAQCA